MRYLLFGAASLFVLYWAVTGLAFLCALVWFPAKWLVWVIRWAILRLRIKAIDFRISRAI